MIAQSPFGNNVPDSETNLRDLFWNREQDQLSCRPCGGCDGIRFPVQEAAATLIKGKGRQPLTADRYRGKQRKNIAPKIWHDHFLQN
jgi:hypothetical protein